ncbi:MAG: VanW family protein, partial [Cytophagaceae bacterium]|nr:VanW family protein [Cytophagaceae bacterium]
MILKKIIPPSLRLHFRVFLRKCKDIISGDYSKFARARKEPISFPYKISLTQPIKKTAHFENKVHNIGEGAKKAEQVIIFPNEIFSFWHIIKKPDSKNNYRIGRNLISGKLSEDYGGGLCQVSSIIYHISLLGGLEVQERHNHSIDIYEEQDRFIPLGADAAVVFGYKDLKIKNN